MNFSSFPFSMQYLLYCTDSTTFIYIYKGKTILLDRFFNVIEIGHGYNYSIARVTLVKDVLVCMLSSSRLIP